MRYELIAILGILLCLVVLGIEYLWLYIMACKQEDYVQKYEEARKKVSIMIEAALYSPTQFAKKDEIKSLKNFAANDTIILEMICDDLLKLQEKLQRDVSTEKAETVQMIYTEIDPISIFGYFLINGDVYNKGFAARKLAAFGATEYIDDIRVLLNDKHRDLSYNAAMSLSELGDADSVSKYIMKIQDDKNYSYRLVMELFAVFTGDKGEVAKTVIEVCNEYMKTTVIKAISPDKLVQFEKLYLDGLKSTNVAMKISCVKALGMLEKPENEHSLLIALNDKDWVVRSAAIKGLQKLDTQSAVEAIKGATKDKEWWVRQAAAQALLDMKVSIKDLEEIMKGYDKYAADAVKYSLYRAVDLREGDIK